MRNTARSSIRLLPDGTPLHNHLMTTLPAAHGVWSGAAKRFLENSDNV
jgi:hypothetical protein